MNFDKFMMIDYAFRIKPLMRLSNDGKPSLCFEKNVNLPLTYIGTSDISCQSFAWNPSSRVLCDQSKLKVVDTIEIELDDCDFFFKPTICDILQAIPENEIGEVDAFEIYSPDFRHNCSDTCYVTIVLYKYLEKYTHPQVILEQPVICDNVKYDSSSSIIDEYENAKFDNISADKYIN